jgi:tRNA pseudouridine38-40 synthase
MVSGNGTAGHRRLALCVQYDGTQFNGWQIQNDGRTVQGEIERALGILMGKKIRVVACGRTDSGVHAKCQIVHFDSTRQLPLQRIAIGMNGILPDDVSVENVYAVPDAFNARFDPVEREYLYRIYNHPLRSPFARNRAMWDHEPLDEEYMAQAASYLIGEHDFASFCKTISAKEMEHTIRTIYEIRIERDGYFINVTIRGNAFLHNMIRSIIGTMIGLYRNGSPPSAMCDVLAGKDRRCGGATVAPYGLYLNRVIYDPPLSTYPSAF